MIGCHVLDSRKPTLEHAPTFSFLSCFSRGTQSERLATDWEEKQHRSHTGSDLPPSGFAIRAKVKLSVDSKQEG